MGCESCTYQRALDVAQEITTANVGNIFTELTRAQKVAELAIVKHIFEKVSPDCTGKREDGSCAINGVVNDARSFIFSNPTVEIVGRQTNQLGFSKGNHDSEEI